MNLSTLIAIERSLLALQLYTMDAMKEHLAAIADRTGMYMWRHGIKKNGNAFLADIEKEYAAYYKAFPNDAESNLEFNKADAIANAMATAIQHVITHPSPNTELTRFVAFLNAYVEGDIKVEEEMNNINMKIAYKKIRSLERRPKKVELINLIINLKSRYLGSIYNNENIRQQLRQLLRGNKSWSGDVLHYFLRRFDVLVSSPYAH